MSVSEQGDLIDGLVAYDERGLVPCVVQDWRTGEVLTVAYMNADALARTRETGEMHFFSRSRQELWHKGETSGNTQALRAIRYDCDADTLLALVEPAGPACHHNLFPLRPSFVDDCETPVSAFLKLREDGPAFLLESADQGQRVGRYSFIGFRPREVIRWSLGDPGDPYEIAAAAVARHRQAPLPDLPPFAGGAVGVFGYDLVRTVEPLGEPNPDPVGVPDLALMLTDVLVVFDHLKHTVSVLANVYADEDVDTAYAAAHDAIADVRWRLAGPVPRPSPAPGPPRALPAFPGHL